jgi:hypothetical protein
MDSFCENMFTIPQFTGTCWFNSLLMALFYSELCRNFFFKHLEDTSYETKKKKKYFYKVVEHMLRRTYVKNENYIHEIQDKLKPENILIDLHKLDPKTFYFNPNDKYKEGWWAELYLPQLFEYMDIRDKVLFLNTGSNDKGLAFSDKNKKMFVKKVRVKKTNKHKYTHMYVQNSIEHNKNEFENINNILFDLSETPKKSKTDINLHQNLMNMALDDPYFQNIMIPDNVDIIVVDKLDVPLTHVNGRVINFNTEVSEKLEFKNSTFILDSLLLINYNTTTCSLAHQICGITCKKNRYLYNGWQLSTKDPAMFGNNKHTHACGVFKFDWFNETKKSFCINTELCDFPPVNANETKDVCFNIKKGPKTYIFVRDSYANKRFEKNDTIANSPYSPFVNNVVNDTLCDDPEKIFNPVTSNCVKRNGVIGRRIIRQQLINDTELDKKRLDDKTKLDKKRLDDKEKLDTSPNMELLVNCLNNYSGIELKKLVDVFELPKVLKTRRKSQVCDVMYKLLPMRLDKPKKPKA